MKFKKSDVLIVDASDETIASGGTSATLLAALLRRGVKLYSVTGLHAKVYSSIWPSGHGEHDMEATSRASAAVSDLADRRPELITRVRVLAG